MIDRPTYLPAEIGVKLYADDVKFYHAHKHSSDPDIMHTAINGLERWSEDWLISIAAEKCVALFLGKRNTHTRYIINGRIIPSTERSET